MTTEDSFHPKVWNSLGRALLSPLERGSRGGLRFPHQHETGFSPGQRSERWQEGLGYAAKCSCPSQQVLKHTPGSARFCRGASQPGCGYNHRSASSSSSSGTSNFLLSINEMSRIMADFRCISPVENPLGCSCSNTPPPPIT